MENRRQFHPLNPLSLEEIKNACDILKEQKKLSESFRFASVLLDESTQDKVLSYKEGDAFDRCASICVFDGKNNETFEAIVSLTSQAVIDWQQIRVEKEPYGQPPIILDEFIKCERIVKADPEWRAAMKERGIKEEDIDNIQVDPFSAGYFADEHKEETGKRLIRAICFYRENVKDNGYARPIEGIVAVVDPVAEQVVRIDNDGLNTPIPKTKINYDTDSYPVKRNDIKPLEIIQREGPSFKVNNWEVEWQGWKFRVGFTPREGLILHDMRFQQDDQKERPVIYRASVTDMIVPYADPTISHYWKSAFDAGEYGLGKLANKLELGCDCLGNIHYFDVPAADDFGNPILMRNAICMHEEDAGVLWKHYEFRTDTYETRRARELVISFFTTIGNYDYGFYWRLGQDASLKLEIKSTGIVQTAAITPGTKYEFGGMLTPELGAPLHQHIFNVRIHPMIDGVNNSVSESEVGRLPVSETNPHGNRIGEVQRELEHEQACDGSAATQRSWKIYNPSFHNAVGLPTAYRVDLPQTTMLLADPSSSVYKRGEFASKQFWVTPYQPKEKYAAGDYPNQSSGGEGLPKYVQQNRNTEDKSVVVWLNVGMTHTPRPEDFPVMPVTCVRVGLHPSGFFNSNPTMNLPRDYNQKKDEQSECCHRKQLH